MLHVLASAPATSPQLDVPMLTVFLLSFALLATLFLRLMRSANKPKRPAVPAVRQQITGGRFGRLGVYADSKPVPPHWLN